MHVDDVRVELVSGAHADGRPGMAVLLEVGAATAILELVDALEIGDALTRAATDGAAMPGRKRSSLS